MIIMVSSQRYCGMWNARKCSIINNLFMHRIYSNCVKRKFLRFLKYKILSNQRQLDCVHSGVSCCIFGMPLLPQHPPFPAHTKKPKTLFTSSILDSDHSWFSRYISMAYHSIFDRSINVSILFNENKYSKINPTVKSIFVQNEFGYMYRYWYWCGYIVRFK